MHDTALIAKRHIRARENVIRNRLPENLNAQHICYYLLRLTLDIRMYESYMVVATDDVS